VIGRNTLAGLALWLSAATTLMAQTPTIEYVASMNNPVQHLYSVELDITGLRSTQIDVAMPAWSPGVYAIRDFARNVQEFAATTRQGRQPLRFEQVDKQTWRVAKSEADDVRIRYKVFSPALTDEMADLTPAAVFMYVVGQTQSPVDVKFETPGDWKVYTALEKRGDRFHASSYDELAASATFVGEFKVVEFKSAAGTRHAVVFSNPRIQMTELQVEADLEDLANAAATMFGKAPYRDYTFLVKVQTPIALPQPSRSSSRLTAGENDFVSVASYNTFLAAAAQSLAESWIGDALRPPEPARIDYSKEAYSRVLWFTKGVSAYLGDLLLLRAGITRSVEYLQVASSEINALQHQNGRLLNSLEDASWNAWTRSDNAANAVVSYTLKGKIAGLLLDGELRTRSSGAASLEKVIRDMAAEGRTIDEGALAAEIQTRSGVDVRGFFADVVRGVGELDYDKYLTPVGLKVASTKTPPTPTFGIEFERAELNQARIRRVLPGSPAEAAKLDSGDLILAMDSERVIYDNLVGRIHSKKIGKAVALSIMRGDRLLELSLLPALSQTETWSVAESLTAAPDQVLRREALLASTRQ